ncbi:MAG TPA: hypothetical protein VGI74_03255 [Streptosporangiaceae bacterium]
MLDKKLGRLVRVLAPLAAVGAMLSPSAPAGARVVQAVLVQAPAVAGDRLADPGRVLPAAWNRSPDKAVTVAGDATGLHVLVADEADGYSWRTVATLGAAGTGTARWIGQACVTGGGRRAVVVYAPAQITSSPDELGSGALAAVVDLSTGKVTPVGAGVSIAYFDPGCGTGQDAVLTQGGWAVGAGQAGQTRLMMLDAATGRITGTAVLPGEVASAVPYRGKIAAVYGRGIASIGPGGRVTALVKTTGTPFRLVPDATGGLGYQMLTGQRVQVRRYAAGRDRLVATAGVGAADLSQIGGRVFITGPDAARLARLPAGWHAVTAPAISQVSTTGELAVLATAGAGTASGRGSSLPGDAPDQPQPVHVTGWAGADGSNVTFTVPAAAQPGSGLLPPSLPGLRAPGPAGGPAPVRPAGTAVSPPPSTNPATTTYDPDRSCSVPRNDPKTETYQPSDPQIEWATDEAVRGDLTHTRGPNLDGSGLPAYTPQGAHGLFPLPALAGGGTVPPQVMLGIETQESSLFQASDHVIIGQAGNFEPSSSWYGDNGNFTKVDWKASDCGYGIAQITAGMCLKGYSTCTSPMPYTGQLAVAVDYQANIAAGLRILAGDWNQLHRQGITANGGKTQYIEDWYFAIWDYNSGMEPNAANGNTTGCTPGPSCTDKAGNWGLGWADNPANDAYPPDRPAFLNGSSAQAPGGGTYTTGWDMDHPQYWPYQEKVLGWAFNGFSNWNFLEGKDVQAYAKGHWPSGATAPAAAPHTEFCTSADHCNPADVPPGAVKDPANPCQLTGAFADHCWWHGPASWASCQQVCGTGVFSYSPTAPDPGDPGVPPGYPPVCNSSPLPASAVIVGDTASSIPAPLGCGQSWHDNGGTMTWKFAAAHSGKTTTYPSKIDFHQVAGGYGGHFWFTHTMAATNPSSCIVPSRPTLEVTGTWKPPAKVQGMTTIWAAVPNVGAQAPDAVYQIVTKSGQAARLVTTGQDKGADTWIDLGTFDLGTGAHVMLNNVTCQGGTGDDIAWEAMAFVPAATSRQLGPDARVAAG